MKMELRRLWPNFPLLPESWRVPGLILLLFFGALFWAKAKDPYKRLWITLKPKDGPKCKGVVVLPKPVRPVPVVFFVHGEGESMLSSGIELRQMAEMGLATANIDYEQSSQEAFDAQFGELLRFVGKQPWAKTNQVAWIGSSLGAARLTSFAATHPEWQPQLTVQLGANWQPEQVFNFSNTNAFPFKGSFTFLQSGQETTASSKSVKRRMDFFQTNGMEAKLKVLTGLRPDFEPNRNLLFRVLGEKCLTFFDGNDAFKNYRSITVWDQGATSLGFYWMPALAWIGWWIYTKRREFPPESSQPPAPWEKWLRLTAIILAIIAVAQTAWHLIPPRLAVSENTLAIARQSLIAPKWTEDFDALAHEPYWRGQKMKTLLTHVELANYCVYELINWKLDTNIYRQFVLSPMIENTANSPEAETNQTLYLSKADGFTSSGRQPETDPELNWRRPLWEFYYPRIRKENDTSSAAEIVVRTLRERITIDPGHAWPEGIESIWKNQIATPHGFERIYVATLRSAGVPARLDKNKKAEFWTGTEWKIAPRPLVETWL